MYVYLCMYACMYVCILMYACMYACMYAYIHTCVCVNASVAWSFNAPLRSYGGGCL